MPRTADPTAIPERLLDAGLHLFLRQGYNGTGVQQIADRAGVPKGSFYNHFESKETFAAAIVDRFAQYNRRQWQRVLRSAPPEPMAAIRHIFAYMFVHHEQVAASPTGCLVGNLAAEIAVSSDICRQSLLGALSGWCERMSGLIAKAQESGDIRDDIEAADLASLAWNVWEGALLRVKIERTLQPLRDSTQLIFERLFRPLPASIPGPNAPLLHQMRAQRLELDRLIAQLEG